ncbi:arogenate dehydratase [Aureococcus anophagefferens]|nr:arogenate dehydratase [Aureococcus anophagefferens]
MAARALVALLAVDVASACWTLDLGHNLNPGSAHATCPGVPNGEVCAPDGSSNYHFWDGAYHNGIFRGVFQTNQCSNDKWGYCPLCDPPQYLVYANHSANCVNQTVPAPQYDPKDGPHGAQLRGRVGMTLAGVNIYGPEEAGFGFGPNPMPCTDGTGYCYAGVDVPTCESALDIMCSATGSKVVHELMLDSCGGHAFPHSVLIGIALDGHGIYGLYESYNETSEEQVTPDDLDACNGHTHGVPANATYGVDEAAHYHTTSWAPYTVGCFGPVDSVDECKSLYQGDEVETEASTHGHLPDLHAGVARGAATADCPCFEKSNDRYGRNSNLTVAECACYNVCDEVSNTDCGSVSCDAMLASGDFHCADDFCPTCPKKNWCDKSCGFGTCADPVVADIAERRLKRLFAWDGAGCSRDALWT